LRYLLDTNICIYIQNGRHTEVVSRFEAMAEHELGVSVITASELAFGAQKSGLPRNVEALKKFLLPLQVYEFTDDVVWRYAQVRTDLQRAGSPIGPLDTLIAAHALALDAVLVTNNRKEFDRVSGLRVENWVG
jgi:tRNA(fMet)-specific endonuclease VapC